PVVLVAVARGPANQENDFAGRVQPAVVVVRRRVAGDAVAGEHDRGRYRAGAREADGPEFVVELELLRLAVGAGEADAGPGAKRRAAADDERLEVTTVRHGPLEPRGPERGGDVIGGLVDPRGAGTTALAFVRREEREIGPHAGDGRVLGFVRPDEQCDDEDAEEAELSWHVCFLLG